MTLVSNGAHSSHPLALWTTIPLEVSTISAKATARTTTETTTETTTITITTRTTAPTTTTKGEGKGKIGRKKSSKTGKMIKLNEKRDKLVIL